jgi:nucleoside-diphosphate-sugar epimerase
MPNYLVTGGAGFIGSNLVKYLVERGETVRVVDNFATGRRKNLQGYYDRIDFIEGDILDDDVLKPALYDIDYVLHQAAIPSVQRSVENPIRSNDANINGTLKLLEAARKARVKRLVYAGSSSAYGDQPVKVKSEDLNPMPLSPYAITKLTGEYYCAVYYRIFGLETISLRYFNVFGPNQDPTSQYSAVIPRFITAALQGQQPTIYGDGYQSRDFTYVENNVVANLLAAETTKGLGQTINIACGTNYSLHDLLRVIGEIVGKRIEPLYAPPRKGDVRHSLADIRLARELLGYEVIVPFEEGIRRTIEWYKKELAQSKDA